MKNLLILLVISLLIGTTIGAIASITEHKTHDENGVVICGTAFMYNMEGATVKTVEEVEAITSLTCDKENRKTNHYDHQDGQYKGKNKHVYLSKADKICTINWELTPEAHIAAFKEQCQ